MKKNIAIVVLFVALLLCLSQLLNDQWHAAQMRAAHKLVRVASSEVWKRACEHAAAGNRDRAHWCEWAATETSLSSKEDASDEDMEALALRYVEAKTGKQ